MQDPAVQSAPAPAPPGQLPSRVRHWVMVFAVALAVITYIDRVAISWAAPYIQHDLSLDSGQMGLVLGAFGWAYAIFEIPGGFLGDWIGPRKVLTRVVLWWSFFTAATGWARSASVLTVTRFLFGAGEAGCFPNLTKIFSVWLPAQEKVRAQGIVWMAARWGGAFTPPLVSFVILCVGWRHAFELFGLIGPVWAILFYLWFRDNPMDHRGLNQAERDLVSSSSRLAAGHADVPWLRFISSGRVWLLCWQYFCLTYGWYFYITWLPTYLRNGRHLEIASSAMLSMLPLFLGGLANPISVFLGERLTRRTHDIARTRRILCCSGFAGACLSLMGSTLAANPVLAVLAIAMASFCGDLTMPHAWSATMDLGGRYAGTLSGAMNSWGNLGGAISPMVIGYVLQWTGSNWNLTFYVASAVYACGILCWLFLDSTTPIEGTEAG
jgi:ACS family glucarate transporter-like MFS transporter